MNKETKELNGCPLSENVELKTFTTTTSSMTPEEEIKDYEEAIKKYTESFMFTNWWNIFKIRHTQKMIRSYQKSIEELKKA